MKQTILVVLFFISQIGFGQVKDLFPEYSHLLDFSDKAKAEWGLRDTLMQQLTDGKKKWDSFSQDEKHILQKYGEVYEDIWDIVGSGCSWYCGGGPKKVSASSYLSSQGKINYKPENAHDLSYKNAWVEGVSGYGVGEYLTYTFEHNSPRITDIIVVNGYVKSTSSWINNSRVKKLKVYIDDEPYAILNLRDEIAAQYFKVDTLGYGWSEGQKQPDWTLRFEILEVYKGNKYDDTVISEIYFDGIDVHCFVKGTKVLMADGLLKNIENIQVGDEVISFDEVLGKKFKATVEKTERVKHGGLVTYIFESGKEITTTKDHPFKLKDKSWASLAPHQSKQYKGFEHIETIEVGDFFLTIAGEDQLIAIKESTETQMTYTISALNKGMSFIANGFVVAVERVE